MVGVGDPGPEPGPAPPVPGHGGWMTDYLGRMAARSLDRLPSLRPRLRSRYESASPAAGWGEEEQEVERVLDGPARPRAGARRPASRAGAPAASPSPTPPYARESDQPGAVDAVVEAGAAHPGRRPAGAGTAPRGAAVAAVAAVAPEVVVEVVATSLPGPGAI